ncbi:MAG TPA: DUF4962 domain-containing protein [Sedimentisphaerales bacterium]|nr:DUF4962 domain-containing protein [Sedimentisphaerales bacterium]
MNSAKSIDSPVGPSRSVLPSETKDLAGEHDDPIEIDISPEGQMLHSVQHDKMNSRSQVAAGGPLQIALVLSLALLHSADAQSLQLDQRPAEPGTWGYRPEMGAVSQTDPPSFSWRPQQRLTWEIECARDANFESVVYRGEGIEFNVHCPPRTFGPGGYFWRYRGKDSQGQVTAWSRTRSFSIAPSAVSMPLPERSELIARIPKTHPRLFLRPENLDRLRGLARGELKSQYQDLVKECDRILANPPSTQEPPKYPPGMETKSEEWREIWWGNRTYTIKVLDSAATLAFTRLLGGQDKYGQEARRILLECAKWDPKGSTGYRYNDEAGMPYNYLFSRTYTFVNDLLTDDEKEICRKVMKIRGDEMYSHLCPRHLWQPYASHSNRAWHKLGEIGIAFLDEVEGAEDWVWFATNVFFNVYPVWSDEDGGWHEGSSYWASYLSRFTWWADVMREAMGIDAYDKPFFSKVGYYAMYLMPPGKADGGFGDLAANKTSKSNVPLMSILAAQAQNPYWQWYVDQHGGPVPTGGYVGFIRGQLPKVQPKAPNDLPASRLFEGTGQAYLNTNLTNADDSVQVVFKSSPFGTQSHGYESNNSFLLWAYGKRMLIGSGYRDIYGSDHHQNWMWTTRSTNCITINGQGQKKHTVGAQGRITAFLTTPQVDAVIGDASDSYGPPVQQFKRAILFIKPDMIVIYDRLKTSEPSSYEYWLHAIDKFEIRDQQNITTRNGDVTCDIAFLTPQNLTFTQTNEYDPNPRERIKLREWHLTAKTTDKQDHMEFVTIYCPHKDKDEAQSGATLQSSADGYMLTTSLSDGELSALLPVDDHAPIKLRLGQMGQAVQFLDVREHTNH